jgi:hypothetical protein
MEMIRNGEWRATNPGAPSNRRSYHLNSLYAPWRSCDFGELAAQFLTAKAGLIEELVAPDQLLPRARQLAELVASIADEAEELQRKMATEQFTLEDFLKQMRQVRKMGPIGNLLGMMPGMGAMKQLKDVDVDEGELDRVEAIILSMTREERLNPEIIKGSRRRRIAEGSGTRIQQVNNLVKQFGQMRKLMKQVASGGMPDPSQLAKATGRQARPRIRRR